MYEIRVSFDNNELVFDWTDSRDNDILEKLMKTGYYSMKNITYDLGSYLIISKTSDADTIRTMILLATISGAVAQKLIDENKEDIIPKAIFSVNKK